MKLHSRAPAYISLIIAAILWGTTYPIIKIGFQELHLTPMTYLFMRFVFAFLTLSPVLAVRSIRKEVFYLLFRYEVLLLGIMNGAGYILQFLGQVHVTASFSSIMLNTYVLSTPIFNHFFFKKPVERRKKEAAAAGFLGAAVIALGNVIRSHALSVTFYGILMVLGAGTVYGLYIVYSEKIMSVNFRGKTPQPVSLFFASTVSSLLIIFITGLFLQDLPGLSPFPAIALLPVLYLGVLATNAAFILYLISIKELGAVNSAIYLLINIVIGVILSVIMLHEALVITMYIGGSLIFASIFLVQNRNSPSHILRPKNAAGAPNKSGNADTTGGEHASHSGH